MGDEVVVDLEVLHLEGDVQLAAALEVPLVAAMGAVRVLRRARAHCGLNDCG